MSFPLPANFSTELAAVNILLASIGEQPVASLDTVESADAESARNTLNEFSRAIQAKGWDWNREEAYPLSPDSEGLIQLPANCLYMDAAYWSSYGCTEKNISERGRQLYNKTDRTLIWEATSRVYVDMIVYLEWDELPEYARQAILYSAVHRFQMRELTSTAIAKITIEDVAQAMATLEQREDEANPKNAISGNKWVNSAVNGRVQRRP